ncbi:MAG: GDSL-type esterase/lipase family protein, partial [Chthoniobacteraceae bacterium]
MKRISLITALLLNHSARALIGAAMLLVTLLVAESAKAADLVTIVAFGDSTTAVRDSTKIYAAILQDELRNVRIINAGVSGNTTDMARKRFEKDVLTHQPQIAIIQFGINDAAIDVWKQPPASVPRVSLPDYRQNLTSMVQALKAQRARVVLMTSNPIHWSDVTRKLYAKPPYLPEDVEGFNVILRHYAQAVREIAKAEGVGLVDVFAAFKAREAEPDRKPGSLARDGMHPDDEGHRLIADLLIKHLAAVALPPMHAAELQLPD